MIINVLIVEDDPMVMKIIGAYVDSLDGFRVAGQAAGGGDALARIAETPVDLIFLDVYLPVMNGVEFLTALRAQGNSADVIFLTASNDTHVISSALKLGVVDYLIKPFTYERFKAACQNYLRRYQLLRQTGEATQEQLDRMFGRTSPAQAVQKGLHPKTLESVRSFMDSLDGAAFSQNDVARHLGVSKVTIRKYMEYLVAIDEITLHVEHGSIGRPTHTYRKART
ncbi:MAG: response regulator [Planctomycetota bacterium]|jgi:two-component system CitB family response regulator/two-component system response regulator DctR|nr:response regulator [Planctomycetota bacterium]